MDPVSVDRVDESFESLEDTGSSGDEELDEEETDDDDGASLDSDHQGSMVDAGPPSPPVNRTALSLVKERDRSRSSSRSRHRSGSPSSSSFRTLSPAAVQQPMSSDLSAALQVRLDSAKGEISRLLSERRDHEKEAKQQLLTLNQRLADKEKQVAALTGLLEASKAETQRQLNDIRYVAGVHL